MDISSVTAEKNGGETNKKSSDQICYNLSEARRDMRKLWAGCGKRNIPRQDLL